eukprot:gene8769-6170_t
MKPRRFHLNDDLSVRRGEGGSQINSKGEEADGSLPSSTTKPFSQSARPAGGLWEGGGGWQQLQRDRPGPVSARTKKRTRVVVTDAPAAEQDRFRDGQLVPVATPRGSDLGNPILSSSMEVQRAIVVPGKLQNLKVSLWPVGASSVAHPNGSGRELVAKAPLALQLEAFIRKEHRQFLLDHPGCSKPETLHIFREAFRVLSEHFCEYRGVLTLIQDEYEAALTDVLEQVRQMRIIDLENKSDRSLHAMELAAIKESLNTTISNQRAELQSAQGLIHALREQLASAEKANELLRREIRKNNKEQLHAQEQVKMLSNTIIEEAARSANMLIASKKKDKDIELLNSCVKVLREEVEELHTSLLEQLRMAMELRTPGMAPTMIAARDSSKATKALQKVKEAAMKTPEEQLEEDEEGEEKGALNSNSYPEEYVRSLLNKLDELALEVVKWKTTAGLAAQKSEHTAQQAHAPSSTEEGDPMSPYSSGMPNSTTRNEHDETVPPLVTTSILNKSGNTVASNMNSPKFVSPEEDTPSTSATSPKRTSRTIRRSSTAQPNGADEEPTNPFSNPSMMNVSESVHSSNSNIPPTNHTHTAGSRTPFQLPRYRRLASESMHNMQRGQERQAVLNEFPLIQAWLREEGIQEQELEETDTILPCGNWHGMDMAFLGAIHPVRNLHLSMESMHQLLDRIWTEREVKLTYTRLRTFFLQWLDKETGNRASGKELGVNMIQMCLRNSHDPDCYVFIHALKGFIPEDVAFTWRKGIRHLRRICEQNTNFTLEREQLVHQKILFEGIRGFFPEKTMQHMLQLRFCFFRASGGAEETIRFEISLLEWRSPRAWKTVMSRIPTPALPDYVVRKLTAEGCLKTIRDVAIADDTMVVQLNTVLSRFRAAVLLRRASIPMGDGASSSSSPSPKKKPVPPSIQTPIKKYVFRLPTLVLLYFRSNSAPIKKYSTIHQSSPPLLLFFLFNPSPERLGEGCRSGKGDPIDVRRLPYFIFGWVEYLSTIVNYFRSSSPHPHDRIQVRRIIFRFIKEVANEESNSNNTEKKKTAVGTIHLFAPMYNSHFFLFIFSSCANLLASVLLVLPPKPTHTHTHSHIYIYILILCTTDLFLLPREITTNKQINQIQLFAPHQTNKTYPPPAAAEEMPPLMRHLHFHRVASPSPALDLLKQVALPRRWASSPTHVPPTASAAASPSFISAATGEVVTDPVAHYGTLDFSLREALVKQLACPTAPLPIKAVYLQLCHPFRMVKELYHSAVPRRQAKLRGALRFLRRHNVLLHSLLFYVPELPGASRGTWNTTGEFARLRLYGEAYLQAELRTRLLKLLPDCPQDVFVTCLERFFGEDSYVRLFDALDMASLVGARPPKPEKLRTKVRTYPKAPPGPEKVASSGAITARRPPSEAQEVLRRARKTHRQVYQLTAHQKASMLCAVLGELRWFCARTRPTHRTHNNAIFPPSDVLILHVLAQHMVECIPAEMVFEMLQPHLHRLQETWENFNTSLPSQLKERYTPNASKYRLAPQPAALDQAVQQGEVGEDRVVRHTLTTLPQLDHIFSTIQPQVSVQGVSGGVGSAQYRVFVKPQHPCERDQLLQPAPWKTPGGAATQQQVMDPKRAWELGLMARHPSITFKKKIIDLLLLGFIDFVAFSFFKEFVFVFLFLRFAQIRVPLRSSTPARTFRQGPNTIQQANMSFIVRAPMDSTDCSANTDSTLGPDFSNSNSVDVWEDHDTKSALAAAIQTAAGMHLGAGLSLPLPPTQAAALAQPPVPQPETQGKSWVEVHHLAPSTTGIMLLSLFYPHGADEARTIREKGQLLGLVRFRCCEMAARAAEKMNGFFPMGQNQALRVVLVSLEEVQAALIRAKLQPVSTIYAALSEEAMSPERVARIVESLPYLQAARELSEEVLHADQHILSRITDALMAMDPQWPSLGEFGAELLQRLHLSLIETNCSFQSTSCGVVIANLYLRGIISGDPFRFATNFLQRIGLRVPHVEGICMLAHICGSMDFKVSKASFWAVVREIACNTEDVAISKALLNHLQRYLRHCSHADVVLPPPSRLCLSGAASRAASAPSAVSGMSSALGTPAKPSAVSSALGASALLSGTPPATGSPTPSASPTFSTGVWSASHGAAVSAQEDAKQRTVYISHLPPSLPQNMFMALLTRCGPVNKVRICAGKGYATLFSFVEMGTIAGAQEVTKLSGVNFLGFSIRVQTAKNPIQDDLKEDAELTPGGELKQRCLFGLISFFFLFISIVIFHSPPTMLGKEVQLIPVPTKCHTPPFRLSFIIIICFSSLQPHEQLLPPPSYVFNLQNIVQTSIHDSTHPHPLTFCSSPVYMGREQRWRGDRYDNTACHNLIYSYIFYFCCCRLGLYDIQPLYDYTHTACLLSVFTLTFFIHIHHIYISIAVIVTSSCPHIFTTRVHISFFLFGLFIYLRSIYIRSRICFRIYLMQTTTVFFFFFFIVAFFLSVDSDTRLVVFALHDIKEVLIRPL